MLGGEKSFIWQLCAYCRWWSPIVGGQNWTRTIKCIAKKKTRKPAYYISACPEMLEPFHQNVHYGSKNEKVWLFLARIGWKRRHLSSFVTNRKIWNQTGALEIKKRKNGACMEDRPVTCVSWALQPRCVMVDIQSCSLAARERWTLWNMHA